MAARSPAPIRSPLERALRLRSRVALYASLILTAGMAWLGSSFLTRQTAIFVSPRWARENLAAHPAVLLLQRYLQIDTSQPDANELAGARFLRDVLASEGIPSTIDQIDDRRANLWALIEGRRPEAVVLHHHLDTDPVGDLARWQHPPFSGAIVPPAIFGRGAFDMKSVGIAQLLAFVALHRSGQVPDRSVLFLATGGEEVGSDWGTRRVLERQPNLTRRFWAFLTEGGVVEALNREEIKYWGIEIAQRRVVDIHLRGPRPRVLRLREELAARDRIGARREMTPEVAEFLLAYAASRDATDLRRLLADPGRLAADPDLFARLPEFLRALLVDELFLGEVAGGPESAHLRLRLMLLPRRPLQPTLDELLPPTLWQGLERTVEEAHPPSPGSPTSHPAFRALRAAISDFAPGAASGPFVLGGIVTDARFVRALGVPAYGFSPFAIPVAETLLVGQAGEQISLEGFVDGVELYRGVLERLARDGSSSPPGFD